MAVTDLVTDYGGVGDGQRTSVTGSITSGASPVFTPATNIFAAFGDPTGRAIYLNASGFHYPTDNPPETITAYNSGTGAVTISGTNATPQSSVTFDVLWGTDNTNAFLAYRTWAQGLGATQAQLTIPAGRFCCSMNPATPLNRGVQNSYITGPSGAPATCIISHLTPGEMRLGGDSPISANKGLTHASGTTARLNSTTAGALTATLVDKATYGSRITVGADCFVTGFDMQGAGDGTYGFPPNPFFYETNKITGYDSSGLGTITFQNPLAYAYKSDWPAWSFTAGAPDLGGPATIYVLSDYDRVVEIKDVTLDSPYNQIAALGKSVILRNVRCPGYGVYPTQNTTFASYDTTVVNNYEMDKIVGSVLLENPTIGILQIQSASPNLLTINGGAIRHMTGTPKRLIMDGTVMNGGSVGNDKQIQIGPGWGRTDSISLSNVTGLDIIGDGRGIASGIHGGGLSATMPMASGIFTFLKSENDGAGWENPGRNLIPGTWLDLDHKKFIQITRVWEDGTYVYHQTTETGGWPFTVTNGYAHACPDFTMRTCSGADLQIEDYNQAPARIPFLSYSKRTYVDGPSATTLYRTVGLPVIGKLLTANFTVTPTGVATFHHSFADNNLVMKLNASYATATFAPTINGNIAGTRTLTNNSAATGLQSGDTVPDLATLGPIWFSGNPFNGPNFNVNNTNSVVVAEFILDQGLPPIGTSVLRFGNLRLHS